MVHLSIWKLCLSEPPAQPTARAQCPAWNGLPGEAAANFCSLFLWLRLSANRIQCRPLCCVPPASVARLSLSSSLSVLRRLAPTAKFVLFLVALSGRTGRRGRNKIPPASILPSYKGTVILPWSGAPSAEKGLAFSVLTAEAGEKAKGQQLLRDLGLSIMPLA